MDGGGDGARPAFWAGGWAPLEAPLATHTPLVQTRKGDALYAMELALSLEKLNFQKLRELHTVAEAEGDAQMGDFVEGALLADQARARLGVEGEGGGGEGAHFGAFPFPRSSGSNRLGQLGDSACARAHTHTHTHTPRPLSPQVKSVKQVTEFVSQLRRVGKGLGVFEFDRKLAQLA